VEDLVGVGVEDAGVAAHGFEFGLEAAGFFGAEELAAMEVDGVGGIFEGVAGED
jgi:hypothetical protein